MRNNFLSKAVPRGTRTIWRYLSAFILFFSLSIGQMWAAVTTEVYDASGASSSTAMTKTGSTLAGTYVAGKGGGDISGYTPSNKGVKLRTQATKVTVSETEYGYAVITANSGYVLKSFKIEGTSNGSNSIDLLGVYVDVDATSASTLATALATATNQLSSTVTIPNKSTTYVSSPNLSINASSNIVMLFPGSGDNQMRAIITIGYEEASSGGSCTDATVSFAATSDAIEIGLGESSASTSLTFSSDNASTVSYAVTKGGAATADASVTGTTFTATAAGEYVVTVTQAKDETNNICAVEETVTITVTDANIVPPGASLTVHTPGKYESPTGYNVALTEYNEREYETYFFSYSSSKVYLGIGASYVTDNTTPRLPGFDGVANGDLTSTDNWLNINAAGFSGSNTSPAAEFAVSHSNNSTHYAQIKEGNDFIIKVQGYDQFSFGGRENGSGSGKQFVVTLNGVEQTISHSSTDWNLWRFDLNPATEYIIMVSGDGSNANRLRAFSLRLPEVTKYDVAFAGGDYGTGSMTTLKYKAGATVTAPACGFSSSDATKEFDKWGVTGVAGTTEVAVDGTFAMPAGNVTLTALWKTHAASHDATLKSLSYKIGGGDPIAIPLVTEQYAYAVELPMGTDIDAPVIAAVANDPNIKDLTIVQTNLGQATVTVTAEDNSTIQTYAITFTVATSKDIELVWATDKQRCDATTPSAKALIATASTYLSASYTGSASEGGSLTTGKTTGSKIIITAKPGYAFKSMGFYGKIEDGTCNFYNDGVVETIGTSTSDACYANIFSNDEVHEFVIELTGSNGVYIRNMQLTLIEACTPVAITWDEEPVEFEVGKAGQAIAATANNSGTITYGSTDASIVAVDAGNGVLSVSDLGSVTLSASTAEGDGTTFCANGGNPIVISKAVNTYYLVQFDPQNETAVIPAKYYDGDPAIALPSVSYSGHTFQGWFDAATGGNQITEAIIPAASRTIYAQWTADCAGPTITTQPASANYLTGRAAAALSCEATAGNGGALTYTWYSCDDDVRTNPVELAGAPTPSTAVAGTFYFFCAVTEEGCAVIANSDVVTIVVTDKDPICLIATTVTGATAHGDVTGFLGADRGGDAEVNVSSSSYKMDKGKYIGVTLPDGYLFQEGDKVVINVKTVNQGTGFTLFDSKEGSHNLIIDTRDGNTVAAGANTVVLPAYAGSQSVYVMRENNDATGDLNSALDAVAVYRACAPILNKVTVAGVEATPDNTNHVTIEVPFSTTDDALDAIVYDWVSNNDAWTAAHAPAVANTWEWGVENTVTFADKDGDESVYYITISKAVASSDATLATLTYGGTAIALADGVYEYDVELPYGTSAVPALAATKNHVGATIVSISNAAAFVDRKATSTVTVKAEDATTIQVYTVNFTVSRFESKVLWDGSTMTQMSDITAAATAAGVSITSADISVTSFSAVTCEENGKSYTKALNIGGNTKSTRYFGIEIPAGKVAKVSLVYKARGNDKRSIIIGTAIVGAVDESAITSVERENDQALHIMTADMFGGGTLYINTTNGFHVHEISLQLADGHGRSAMLGNGVLGTVCVPNNVAVEDIQGVTVYELMGRDYDNYGKLAFDEITSGELEEGVPYVFLAHRNHMALLYGEKHKNNPVDKGNGMYGTFSNITLPDEDLGVNDLSDIYYFAQRALWSCAGAIDLTVAANRAYVKLSEVDEVPSPTPAPGRRRILMAVNGENQTQGVDNLESGETPMKVMIDGTLYIIRGEQKFDATGRLVK